MKLKPITPASRFAERTFETYHEGLHRFLLRRLRSAQDASDLMQEVFLRVLQLERTEAVRNPQGYLYGIASHVAMEFRSRRRRDPVTYDSEQVERSDTAPPSSDELAESVALEKELHRALAALPPVQLKILVDRRRDGLDYPQIAQSLGLSPHTVRKYMDRALASIRESLGPREPKP